MDFRPVIAARMQTGGVLDMVVTGAQRVERYTATSDANAAAQVLFSPAFTSPPVVEPSITWNGAQMVVPIVSSVTATGCTVSVMRSKGTLLLTQGPFETAPNTAFRLLVLGS